MISNRDNSSDQPFGVETTDGIVCPTCQSVNVNGRKFCAKCGENLWHECPSCKEENPISDAFCGSCGEDLSQVMHATEEFFLNTMRDAKVKANELDFNKAILLLNSASESDKIRLKSQQKAMRELVATYREQRDELKVEADEHLKRAEYYLEKSAYGRALKVLKSVPEPFRTPEIIELLESIRFKDAESRRLSAEIEKLVSKKEFLEALPKIETLAQLRPADESLPALANDITKRLSRKAEKLKIQGQFKEAFSLIQKIGEMGSSKKIEKLKEEIAEVVWLGKYVKRAQTLDAGLVSTIGHLAIISKSAKYKELYEQSKERLKSAAKKKLRFPEWSVAPKEPVLGVPVQMAKPIKQIAGFDSIAIDGYDQLAFGVAAGLALRGLGTARIEASLNPAKKGFLGFGGGKKANAAWGIDFGLSALKAVRLRLDEKRVVTLDKYERIPYRQHLAQLSDADQRSNMLEVLLQLKAKQDLKKDEVITANMNANQVLGRFLFLPATDEKTMKAALDYEVKLQIPFPLKEIVWDSFIFPELIGENRLALVLAGKRNEAEIIEGLFSANGMRLTAIQPDSVALYNLYHNELKHSSDGKTIAVLDIGSEASNFCVVGQDRIWFRTFGIGGNLFSRRIARDFKLNTEQAEERKVNLESAGKDIGNTVWSMSSPFDDLVAEVQRSIQAYQADLSAKMPKEMWCVGGGSYTHGALTYLRYGPRELSIES